MLITLGILGGAAAGATAGILKMRHDIYPYIAGIKEKNIESLDQAEDIFSLAEKYEKSCLWSSKYVSLFSPELKELSKERKFLKTVKKIDYDFDVVFGPNINAGCSEFYNLAKEKNNFSLFYLPKEKCEKLLNKGEPEAFLVVGNHFCCTKERRKKEWKETRYDQNFAETCQGFFEELKSHSIEVPVDKENVLDFVKRHGGEII